MTGKHASGAVRADSAAGGKTAAATVVLALLSASALSGFGLIGVAQLADTSRRADTGASVLRPPAGVSVNPPTASAPKRRAARDASPRGPLAQRASGTSGTVTVPDTVLGGAVAETAFDATQAEAMAATGTGRLTARSATTTYRFGSTTARQSSSGLGKAGKLEKSGKLDKRGKFKTKHSPRRAGLGTATYSVAGAQAGQSWSGVKKAGQSWSGVKKAGQSWSGVKKAGQSWSGVKKARKLKHKRPHGRPPARATQLISRAAAARVLGKKYGATAAESRERPAAAKSVRKQTKPKAAVPGKRPRGTAAGTVGAGRPTGDPRHAAKRAQRAVDGRAAVRAPAGQDDPKRGRGAEASRAASHEAASRHGERPKHAHGAGR